MISVIIPTYNRCDMLPKALDAVCSQDVESLEVIVVDNNSRDRTAEVVKAYPDPRVKYTLCTRQGCYPALNHGFALASGEYLTWTSDDNWFSPGALRRMLDALESAGADFVYTDYVRRDETTGRETVEHVPPPEDLDRWSTLGPCFLYRRRVYDLLGGYSSRYRWASDYDYWLRVCRAGFRMLPLASPCYTFVYHESCDSHTRGTAVTAEGHRVRMTHGCYARLWARQKDPNAYIDSIAEAGLLWRYGYYLDSVMLAVQVVLHRPLNLSLWSRCANLGLRALTRRLRKTTP